MLFYLNVAVGQTVIGASPYTVPSSGTYQLPPGVTDIDVYMWGGGGGSGGSKEGASVYGAGGGGGGGAFVKLSFTGLTAGSTFPTVIGASGSAGASNGNGGDGGNTSFTLGGTTYTANGGKKGSKGDNSGGAGGAGGAATVVSGVIVASQKGGAGGLGSGCSSTGPTCGGGGGGAGGFNSAGDNAWIRNTTTYPSITIGTTNCTNYFISQGGLGGGSSPYQGGAGANPIVVIKKNQDPAQNGNGVLGNFPGGGAAAGAGSGSRSGAAGAKGLIIIVYTSPASITTSTITGSPFCAGTAVSIPFTIAGTYTAGNVFTAQLSNAAGSFATPTNIGTLTSTSAGTISGTIPAGASTGSLYRIRVVSSTPSITGSDNGANLTINALVTPTITTQPINTTICANNTGQITIVSPTSGVQYQWQYYDIGTSAWANTNGAAGVSGDNTNTLVLTNPPVGYSNLSIHCVLSGSCMNTVISTAITLNISTSSTDLTNITIGANPCYGATTTLTASGGTAGTNDVIIWQKKSSNIAYEQNWMTQPFGVSQTTINSVNGILNLTSTNSDPHINMSGLGSFDPNIYQYIHMRYRVTSAQAANDLEIFWYNGASGVATASQMRSMPLISDGAWHILSVNMLDVNIGAGDWLNSSVTGWRFDWCTANNVTMDIDFISLDQYEILADGPVYNTPPLLAETTTRYVSRRSDCGSSGIISKTITLPTRTANLSGNEAATCYVSGIDPIHFYNTGSGNYIGSVNPNGRTGTLTLTSYTGTGNIMDACNAVGNTQFKTAFMGRNFTVKPTGNITGSGDLYVYFPFTDTELGDLQTLSATGTPGNINDNVVTIADLYMTKHSGPTENGTPYDNCVDGASIVIPLTTRGGLSSGLTLSPVITANYGRVDVASFSEFYFHGSKNNSPLPVTLTNFSANCDNQVSIAWTTASEQNSDRFIVEKSRDLQVWSLVGTQVAAGNSNYILNYSQTDANAWNGTTYYRLRQIDFNGEEKIYGPISTSCENDNNGMVIYPNPSQGNFTVDITSGEKIQDAEIQVLDITGKLVSIQMINISEGMNQVYFNQNDLQMGSYFLRLVGGTNSFKPVRLVIE